MEKFSRQFLRSCTTESFLMNSRNSIHIFSNTRYACFLLPKGHHFIFILCQIQRTILILPQRMLRIFCYASNRKAKKYFLNCNYNSLMNSRQTIFEYHVNTLRNFCKKYKISSKTAIRRYGKKYGKQFIRKEIFEQATLAHGLNADEVVNFLAQ